MRKASPISQCGKLVAIALTAAVVLSPVALLVGGLPGVLGLAISVAICLLPGLVTVWLASAVQDPMTRVWLTVGGMLVRMFVVLIAALVIYKLRPDLGLREFYIWLIVFYNVLLLAETWLLLPRGDKAA